MKTKTKIGALVLALCFVFTASMPVFAKEDKITVKFTDVTNDVKYSANILKGQAKVLVSVQGAKGNATIAEMSLKFDGNLKYSSTQFLKGSGDPDTDKSYWIAKAGKDNSLSLGMVLTEGIDFSDNEELFIITFESQLEGETGEEKVTLSLSDLENTYCIVDGNKKIADGTQSIELTASSEAKEGKTAVISLAMDKLTTFPVGCDSLITVKIINEKTPGDVIATTIDTAMQSDGGHRSGTHKETPTFIVKNTVVADESYTVEASGIGYVTYKKTGVKFENELKITNSEFIPGDVDNDGDVDKDDKAVVEKLIADNDYSILADFNRDNAVNTADLAVFADIKDETENKTDTPTDNNNNNNNNNQENNNGTAGGTTGTTGGTVVVGNGGSTGGGFSGGSSGGSSGGGYSGGGYSGGTTATPSNNETFIDLANHTWAKDSIYTLKSKGIISGVSANEFAPANNIKRGDFILILTRMLNINHEFTENFADVPVDSYYYNAIGSAKAGGIANGNNGLFMPEDSITRQDLITLAYRAFCAMGYVAQTDDLTVLDGFADKDSISDYAKTAMASMVNAGIIQGSDGNVNPLGFATRAEVAVMCARMLNLMK